MEYTYGFALSFPSTEGSFSHFCKIEIGKNSLFFLFSSPLFIYISFFVDTKLLSLWSDLPIQRPYPLQLEPLLSPFYFSTLFSLQASIESPYFPTRLLKIKVFFFSSLVTIRLSEIFLTHSSVRRSPQTSPLVFISN